MYRLAVLFLGCSVFVGAAVSAPMFPALAQCPEGDVDALATLVGDVEATSSSTSTTSHVIPNRVDFLEAYNHYIEAVAEWGRARAEYEKAMGEQAKALAEANIDQAKAQALYAALAQARRDFMRINQVIDAQYERVAKLYRYHRVASDARDGKITPQRARALRSFFIEGAIGKTRRELLGQASRDLLAREPHAFAGILDPDGRIVELGPENFIGKESDITQETYLVALPTVTPRRGGAWELHVRTPLTGTFRKRVEIKIADDLGLPDGDVVRTGYFYRRYQRHQDHLKGKTVTGRFGTRTTYYSDPPPTYELQESYKIVLPPHLPTKGYLWIRVSGGRPDFQTGEEELLMPTFYYVERDPSGRSRTAVTDSGKVPNGRVHWLEEGAVAVKPFKPSTPSTVAGLVYFAARNEYDLNPEQPALDILDAAIATVEANAREQILATANETLKFRKDFAQLELELIAALGEATQKQE